MPLHPTKLHSTGVGFSRDRTYGCLPACRGGFGNLVALQGGEQPPPGGGVHGVLHALSPADMGKLICMEHEYMYVGGAPRKL